MNHSDFHMIFHASNAIYMIMKWSQHAVRKDADAFYKCIIQFYIKFNIPPKAFHSWIVVPAWLAILLLLAGDIHQNPGPVNRLQSQSKKEKAFQTAPTSNFKHQKSNFKNESDTLFQKLKDPSIHLIPALKELRPKSGQKNAILTRVNHNRLFTYIHVHDRFRYMPFRQACGTLAKQLIRNEQHMNNEETMFIIRSLMVPNVYTFWALFESSPFGKSLDNLKIRADPLQKLIFSMALDRCLHQKTFPSLAQLYSAILQTQSLYLTSQQALLTPAGEELKSGDLAMVPEPLYDIMLNSFQCDTELFAGPMNHHWRLPSWCTADRTELFWGGMYDAFSLPTWANMRALANPVYKAPLIARTIAKMHQSLLSSTEAVFILTIPDWTSTQTTRYNIKLTHLVDSGMARKLISIPAHTMNFVPFSEDVGGGHRSPNPCNVLKVQSPCIQVVLITHELGTF